MDAVLKKRLKPALLKTKIEEPHGIVELLNPAYAGDDNKKFMKMYNWLSYAYDFFEQRIGKIIYKNKIEEMRRAIIGELEWKNSAKVLIVSIGTGRDLDFIPPEIDLKTLEITGVDISTGMMMKCMQKWKRRLPGLSLVHSAAEDLPFKSSQFDIVFHVGGINFFNDKAKAMSEMMRVAKKGTKIMVADETEGLVDELYKKSPWMKKYMKDKTVDVGEIKASVPKAASKKKSRLLWDDKFYCITFYK